jgi:hypothetical protein
MCLKKIYIIIFLNNPLIIKSSCKKIKNKKYGSAKKPTPCTNTLYEHLERTRKDREERGIKSNNSIENFQQGNWNP